MAIREGVEGYLYKRGDVVKSWRLRYFVLQPTPEPLLTYYRNVESGEAPANSLLLQGGRVSNDGSPSHGKLFRFDVEADGQRYCLATLNEEDRRTWVAAITAAAARGGTAGASSSDQFPVPHSNGNITPVSSQGLREGSDGSSSASPNGSPGKPGQASLGAHAHVPAAQNEDAFVTPPPTRHARRMTSDAVGSAGHSGGPHGMLRKASSCTALRPPQLPSPLSGRGPGPGTPLPPPSSGKRRSILSVIRGAIMTLSAPSEMASTISEESGDSSTLNGYNANLRPLRSRGPASKALLQDNARGGALSLFEQFERAQQYVDKHRDEFSPERLSDLQGWAEAARNTAQHSAEASLAATALYVLEVTRTNSSWATWSESDTHFVSPENMISEVRRWPSVRTLEDLRECLSFGATSWIAVYCRLGGAELLMEALGVHKEAAEEGSGEASEALLATLQCMHTLMSGAGGIAASLAAAGLVAKLCMILDVEDPEGSKLVIDMLVKLCLFSSQGYSIALKTLLGEDTSKASLGPGTPLPLPSALSSAGPAPAAPPPPPKAPKAAPPCAPPPPLKAIGQGKAPPPMPPPPPPGGRASPAGPPVPPPPPPPPPPKPAGAAGQGKAPPPMPPPPPPGGQPKPAAPPPPAPPLPSPSNAPKPKTSPSTAGSPLAAALNARMAQAEEGAVTSAPASPPTPSPPAGPAREPISGGKALFFLPPPPPPPPPKAGGAPPAVPGTKAASAAAGTSPLGAALQARLSAAKQGSDATPAADQAKSASAGPPGNQKQQGPNVAHITASGSSSAPSAAGAPGAAAPAVPAKLQQLGGALQQRVQQLSAASVAQPQQPQQAQQVPANEQPGGEGSPAHAPDPLPEYCSTLVALLKVEGYNGVDIELCDHVVLFVNVAIDSIEAVPDLRKRFVTALLEKGLMKAVAELQEFGDAHINEELEVLKLKIREVLAPPKPSPTKAKAPPPAAPAPPRPPPPPPPGMRPGGPRPPPPPSKPKVAPGPQPGRKMKSFFWDKLPDNRVSGTFWERNPPSYDNLDTAEVEELFQALQRTSLKKATTAAKKLAVLDLKRATAIGIRMSRLKVPWEHMRTAIVTLDGDAFRNADDVRTLLQCVPTDDERKMLDSYIKTGGKPELLSAAELFCLDLMKVPRIEARLGTFTARFEAMQQLQEARGVLTDHLAAHRELRASGSFRAVLVLALALGNFMNWGTRLGQAPGFRLKNLPKLQDTRSLDGKTTLLRYIAHTLCTADPPHRLLSQEVPHVSGATLKTSQQEIADMVDKVAAMMASVRAELKHVRQHVSLALQARGEGVSVQLQSDNYHDIMCETLQEVEGEVEQLQAVQKQCRESFAGLVAFFGENVNALASDADFWPDVQAFVERFSACQRQIFHQIQEQEDMRRRKEIQRTSSERLTRSPTAVKPHQALRSPSSPTPTAPVGQSPLKPSASAAAAPAGRDSTAGSTRRDAVPGTSGLYPRPSPSKMAAARQEAEAGGVGRPASTSRAPTASPAENGVDAERRSSGPALLRSSSEVPYREHLRRSSDGSDTTPSPSKRSSLTAQSGSGDTAAHQRMAGEPAQPPVSRPEVSHGHLAEQPAAASNGAAVAGSLPTSASRADSHATAAGRGAAAAAGAAGDARLGSHAAASPSGRDHPPLPQPALSAPPGPAGSEPTPHPRGLKLTVAMPSPAVSREDPSQAPASPLPQGHAAAHWRAAHVAEHHAQPASPAARPSLGAFAKPGSHSMVSARWQPQAPLPPPSPVGSFAKPGSHSFVIDRASHTAAQPPSPAAAGSPGPGSDSEPCRGQVGSHSSVMERPQSHSKAAPAPAAASSGAFAKPGSHNLLHHTDRRDSAVHGQPASPAGRPPPGAFAQPGSHSHSIERPQPHAHPQSHLQPPAAPHPLPHSNGHAQGAAAVVGSAATAQKGAGQLDRHGSAATSARLDELLDEHAEPGHLLSPRHALPSGHHGKTDIERLLAEAQSDEDSSDG